MHQPQQPMPPQGYQQPQPGFQPQQPMPPQGYQQPQPGFQPQQPATPAFPQQPQPGFQPQQPMPQQGNQQPATSHPIPSLAGAKAGNNTGRYLPVGEYAIEVNGVLINPSFQGDLFFVVEFTVLESSNPAVGVGEQYSWVRAFRDQYGYGPNDIKGWICLVVEHKVPGSNPSAQWDDGFIAWVASEQGQATHAQPARGIRMHCSVWEKPNKRKKGSTTIHDWRVMDEGETLGLVPTPVASAHAPAPAPLPATMAPPAAAPAPAPQAPPVPQPAPIPGSAPMPQLPAQPPNGWPAGMPWPGAQQ